MKTLFRYPSEQVLKTICGKEYSYIFKTMKLVRDEEHNFHVVYKTFTDEYIYSSCNPFQDANISVTYYLISESEARNIFLKHLSPDNARDLFDSTEPAVVPIY